MVRSLRAPIWFCAPLTRRVLALASVDVRTQSMREGRVRFSRCRCSAHAGFPASARTGGSVVEPLRVQHSTESARPSLCGISFPGPRECEAGRGYHAWPSAVEVAVWCAGGLLQGRASSLFACGLVIASSCTPLEAADNHAPGCGMARAQSADFIYIFPFFFFSAKMCTANLTAFQQVTWEIEAVRVRVRPLWLLLSAWILSYPSNIFILHVPAAGGLCL